MLESVIYILLSPPNVLYELAFELRLNVLRLKPHLLEKVLLIVLVA